jgi:hypothetical protein
MTTVVHIYGETCCAVNFAVCFFPPSLLYVLKGAVVAVVFIIVKFVQKNLFSPRKYDWSFVKTLFSLRQLFVMTSFH